MANDEWRTPNWVWEPYGPFDLDAAATAENSLAPKFITKEMNAFTCNWNAICPAPARVWCNPPYSKPAGPLNAWVSLFLHKSKVERYHIFAMLPADTSTKWFHRLWSNSYQQFVGCNGKFLTERVCHLDPVTGKPSGSPKFGSLILEFKP